MQDHRKGRFAFGRVDQVGIVVRDIEKTMDYYSSQLGIGPFEVREVARTDAVVRGKVTPYRVKLAFARAGSVELELIQVLEGRTIHTEFLENRGEGLHHLGFNVDDLDAAITRAGEQGIGVLQTHRYGGRGFAYLDTESASGVIFELIKR